MLCLGLLACTLIVLLTGSNGFTLNNNKATRSTRIYMGLADMFAKALANDPSIPPAQNAGLSSSKQPVEVEFFPSGKKVKAYLGQDIPMIAKAAKVEIKYSCKKGECGTCMINYEGKLVKACQSYLPSASKQTKFKIGIIPKK